MSCYIRTYEHILQTHYEVWKVENNTISRLGVTNPPFFVASPGEDIMAAVERQCPSWFENGNPFQKTILGPGEYYPRIARPADQYPHEAPGRCPGQKSEANMIAIARGQLVALTRQLSRICETIHPKEEMLKCYGHEICNLLILACTEVENQWRGVLTANGLRAKHYTRHHYQQLNGAMRLAEYGVSFPNYPWLPAIRPFMGWGDDTHALPWFDAYNGVKHYREEKFETATLGNAFNAVSACFVMLAAQYGVHGPLAHRPELNSFFHLAAIPVWPLSEVYLFPYGQGPKEGYAPKLFPFQL